jgi:hypothetical protein
MTILYAPSTPDLYPRSVADFRAAFPGLAVGDNPRDEDVAEFGWRVVAPTAPPTPGPDQQVVEAPPVEINDQWQQAWQLVNVPPPPPVADWLAFAAWLYQFPPIAAGMDAARLSTDPQGEPATTGLPTALDEARLRQNYPAFSLTWGLFLLASGMPPEALGAIVTKATECNLPGEFIAALQPSPAEN